MDVLIRPDDLMLDMQSPLQAEVLCQAPSHHDHPIGSRVGLRPDFGHLAVFPRRPQEPDAR